MPSLSGQLAWRVMVEGQQACTICLMRLTSASFKCFLMQIKLRYICPLRLQYYAVVLELKQFWKLCQRVQCAALRRICMSSICLLTFIKPQPVFSSSFSISSNMDVLIIPHRKRSHWIRFCPMRFPEPSHSWERTSPYTSWESLPGWWGLNCP